MNTESVYFYTHREGRSIMSSTTVSNPYSFNMDENDKYFMGVPAFTDSIGFNPGDKFEIVPDRKGSSSVIGWDAEGGYGQVKRLGSDNVDSTYKYHISCIRLQKPRFIYLGIINGSNTTKFTITIGSYFIRCNWFSSPSNISYYRGDIYKLKFSFEVGVPITVKVSQL